MRIHNSASQMQSDQVKCNAHVELTPFFSFNAKIMLVDECRELLTMVDDDEKNQTKNKQKR